MINNLSAGTALGALAPLLVLIAKGIIIGATVGGLAGGAISAMTGRSFFEGFEDGAFSGAISGAITGGMISWMSAGSQVVLSVGKVALIGGISNLGASVIGNLGDMRIKGENISFGEFMFDAVVEFGLGFAFAGLGNKLAKKYPVFIEGLTKGRGSWSHVWATQLTRTLRQDTKVSLKTILKGIGSEAIKDTWDAVLEPVKNSVKEFYDRYFNPFPKRSMA